MLRFCFYSFVLTTSFFVIALFCKKGAVVVSTSSPVIVAKAQAHDISKCAEEQLPPCSTLLPRFESIEEKKPMSCEAQMCVVLSFAAQ